MKEQILKSLLVQAENITKGNSLAYDKGRESYVDLLQLIRGFIDEASTEKTISNTSVENTMSNEQSRGEKLLGEFVIGANNTGLSPDTYRSLIEGKSKEDFLNVLKSYGCTYHVYVNDDNYEYYKDIFINGKK